MTREEQHKTEVAIFRAYLERLSLDLGGDAYSITLERSVAVLKGAESAVGAIRPFVERCSVGLATKSEIRKLIRSLAAESGTKVPDEVVAEWVDRQGVVGRPSLMIWLAGLTVGTANIDAFAEELALVGGSVIQAFANDYVVSKGGLRICPEE